MTCRLTGCQQIRASIKIPLEQEIVQRQGPIKLRIDGRWIGEQMMHTIFRTTDIFYAYPGLEPGSSPSSKRLVHRNLPPVLDMHRKGCVLSSSPSEAIPDSTIVLEKHRSPEPRPCRTPHSDRQRKTKCSVIASRVDRRSDHYPHSPENSSGFSPSGDTNNFDLSVPLFEVRENDYHLPTVSAYNVRGTRNRMHHLFTDPPSVNPQFDWALTLYNFLLEWNLYGGTDLLTPENDLAQLTSVGNQTATSDPTKDRIHVVTDAHRQSPKIPSPRLPTSTEENTKRTYRFRHDVSAVAGLAVLDRVVSSKINQLLYSYRVSATRPSVPHSTDTPMFRMALVCWRVAQDSAVPTQPATNMTHQEESMSSASSEVTTFAEGCLSDSTAMNPARDDKVEDCELELEAKISCQPLRINLDQNTLQFLEGFQQLFTSLSIQSGQNNPSTFSSQPLTVPVHADFQSPSRSSTPTSRATHHPSSPLQVSPPGRAAPSNLHPASKRMSTEGTPASGRPSLFIRSVICWSSQAPLFCRYVCSS
ncbi:hypothetical protein AHF37_10672 [Paragonimus kellicotti]|nr:hypothetical protein AHF37_10672 [Paragonimus kellicotti]